MHATILSQLQSCTSGVATLVTQLRSQQSVSTQGVEGGPDTDGGGLTDQEEQALGTGSEDLDKMGRGRALTLSALEQLKEEPSLPLFGYKIG